MDYVGRGRDSAGILEWDFISDFGLFFAGVVAIVIAGWQAIRERVRRPSLSLAFDPDDPYDYMAGVGTTARQESHWVRLRVQNARGKRSAEDVEVLVVEVSGGRNGGPPLAGSPVIWSNMRAGGEHVTRLTVPPGIARHVDLLGLVEPPYDEVNIPAPVEGHTQTTVQLQIWPLPADGRHELGKGRYDIVLAVVARDTDSREYKVTVTYDGKWWTAEQIKQHLRVEPPKRLPRRRRASKWWKRRKPANSSEPQRLAAGS